MHYCLAILLTLSAGADVTLKQVRALARNYLRDSTEVPMSVDVSTLVTDLNGKAKHQGHLTAGMVFRGYNLKEKKFSLNATKGGLTPFGLMDSLGGDMAAFFGGSALFWSDDSKIEVQQPSGAGKPVTVNIQDATCPPLDLSPKYLFPKHACGETQITLISSEGGDLAIQHVSFESTGAPATTQVSHLGLVQLNAYHYDVDFQLKTLPGETKPYLWPLKSVVSATTAKGTVTITNQYSAKR